MDKTKLRRAKDIIEELDTLDFFLTTINNGRRGKLIGQRYIFTNLPYGIYKERHLELTQEVAKKIRVILEEYKNELEDELSKI